MIKRSILIILLSFFTFSSAFTASQEVASLNAGKTARLAIKPISFEIVEEGQLSNLAQDKPQLKIIRDEKTWSQFWKAHTTSVSPTSAPPVIDFSKKTIVAVIDSDQPNGGYSLKIERIEQRGKRLRIYAVRSQPGADCLNLGMITQPFVIVAIPYTTSQASLVLSTATHACE